MPKVFVLCALYFFLQLICTFPVVSQSPGYRFDHLTIKDGLSSAYVYSILKDSTGFIWFGTGDGLNRFDGYDILVYKNDQSENISLYDNVITSIAELNRGHLLIGTAYGGVYIFDKVSEKFVRNKYHPGDSSSLSHYRVNVIYRDNTGSIWIGTEGGLRLFHLDSGTSEDFIQEPDNKQDLRNQIRSLFKDSQGNFWVGTGSGIFRFDALKKVFSPVEPHPSFEFDNRVFQINSISEDPSGIIWIGANHGLYKYNNDLNEFIGPPYQHRNWLIEKIEIISVENHNYAWVATHWGLYQIDLETNGTKTFHNIPGNDESISNQAMHELFFDNTGLLWIASYNEGIDILKLYESPFQQHVMYSEPFVSYNYSACEFWEDTTGNFWIGSHIGGLLKYDKNLNFIKRFKLRFSDNTEFNGGRVKKILRDADGNLWIGMLNPKPSICIFNEETEILQLIDTTDMHLAWKFPSNFIKDMIEDHKGNMWFGFSSGLYWIKSDEKQALKIHSVNHDELSATSIRDLYEDKSGKVWIASGKGLYSVVPDNHDSLIFIKYLSANNELGVNPVSVYQRKNGQIWIGTNNGLYEVREGTRQFWPVDEGNEFFHSNWISALAEDSKGNLWMATEKGLARYNPSGDKHTDIKIFESIDGLPYEGSVSAPLFQSRSGNFFVTSSYGSQNGFYCFHPDSITINTHIPPIVITDFRVRNEPYKLDSNISDVNHIHLQYSENFFSFEFAALDYFNSEKNQYSYRLEGVDENWIFSGNRRFANYTSVPPGDYAFLVKGSNNDGYWNEKGTKLMITIYPPPWKTWWAYSLYLLGIFLVLFLIIRFYIKRQKLIHELELEQIQTEKLEEVDKLKSHFFANISHEFRTPLTLILGPLEGLLKRTGDDKSKQDLGIMKRNALRLQKLINQLLNLSKLESGKMKLQAEEMDIIPLVKGYIQSFESLAKQKGIDLVFKVAVTETAAVAVAAAGKKEGIILVYVDRDKIEEILYNLLSNAFKFTAEGGRIEISVLRSSGLQALRSTGVRQPADPPTRRPEESDKYIEISISDTGPGIPPEKLPYIFDRFYQADDSYTKDQEGTGIGLALTKELVELHHGWIEVESEVSVGTIFRIYLPLGKEHLKPEQIVTSRQLEIIDRQITDGSHQPLNKTGNMVFHAEDTEINRENDDQKVRLDMPVLLLVEDNADLRSYIRDLFDESFNVIEARHGEEGLKQAIEEVPDLIISDVMMPRMDGYELCKKLKTDERTSHIPVILLTARASKESRIEGLETGADDFIIKPFDVDELLIRINNLLDQRKRLSRQIEKRLKKSNWPAYFSIEDSGITSMDEQFLKRAFKTMKENYSDPGFNVEEFSREMHMSRNQLHRKIKALTHHTAVEFIRRYRLTLAAELIKKKSATIAEIAYDVGFSSPSYFSECFKKQFGVLPSEYNSK